MVSRVDGGGLPRGRSLLPRGWGRGSPVGGDMDRWWTMPAKPPVSAVGADLDLEITSGPSSEELRALRAWYEVERPAYKRLAEYVANTLTSVLTAKGIPHVSVTGRAKEVDSFIEKVASRKQYEDAKRQNTDFSGVRVVAFLESDVQRVVDVVNACFEVSEEHSADKSSVLGANRVGYRSVHRVGKIGKTRSQLLECAGLEERWVEIQVRTVLQHAWAEIEHDRRYKFGGLPIGLSRRLSIVAGVLELADREFAEIAREVDQLAADAAAKAAAGRIDEFDALAVGTAVVREYVAHVSERADLKGVLFARQPAEFDEKLALEFQRFGLAYMRDVTRLLTGPFLAAFARHFAKKAVKPLRFFRTAMVFADAERFFSAAWASARPITVSANMASLMLERYGQDEVAALRARHQLNVLPNSSGETSASPHSA